MSKCYDILWLISEKTFKLYIFIAHNLKCFNHTLVLNNINNRDLFLQLVLGLLFPCIKDISSASNVIPLWLFFCWPAMLFMLHPLQVSCAVCTCFGIQRCFPVVQPFWSRKALKSIVFMQQQLQYLYLNRSWTGGHGSHQPDWCLFSFEDPTWSSFTH